MNGERLMRRPAVSEATGIPASSLYKMVAAGQFPKPVPISTRRVGWRESEVQSWIKGRIEAAEQVRILRQPPATHGKSDTSRASSASTHVPANGQSAR